MALPTNIDTTYADDGVDARKEHQQHHDTLHEVHNTLTSDDDDGLLARDGAGDVEAISRSTYRTIWNPVRYGAVGDGATDDLQAFIDCQTAMLAAGASTMFIPTPPGDVGYFLDGSIPGGPNDITYEGEDHSRSRGSISPDKHVLIGNGTDPIWDLTGTTSENRSVRFRSLSAHNPGAPVIDADNAHNGIIEDCLFRVTTLSGDLTGTIKLRRSPRWSITGKSNILASGGAWCVSARDNCNALTVEPSVIMTGGAGGGAMDISQCQSVRAEPTIETSKFGHRIAATGTDGGVCTDIHLGGYLEAVEEPVSVGVSTDGSGNPVIGSTVRGFTFTGRISNGGATSPLYCVRLGKVVGWQVEASNLVRKTGGTEPVILFEYDASSPSYAQAGSFRDNFWSGGPGDTTDIIKLGTTFVGSETLNTLRAQNDIVETLDRGRPRVWVPPTSIALVPPMVSLSNVALMADAVHLCAVIPLDTARTLDELSVDVFSAGDGSSVVRLGTAQFSEDGTLVGETLTEHGTVDGTSTGTQTVSSISHTVGPGLVGLFALTNGESTTAPTIRSGEPVPLFTPAPSSLVRLGGVRSGATHTGAMPATVPSLTGSAPSVPVMLFQFAT